MSNSLYRPLKRTRVNNYKSKPNSGYGHIGRGMPMTATRRWTNRRRTYRRAPYLNARTGGLLGVEHKWIDNFKGLTLITNSTAAAGMEQPPTAGSASIGAYNAVGAGTNTQQRDGQRIVVTSITFKGIIRWEPRINQTALQQCGAVLVAWVQDRQTNGVQLNSEDVFVNPGGAIATGCALYRNMSNLRRFNVLAVKIFTLPQPNAVWDGTNIETGGYDMPFQLKWHGKMPVTFITQTSTADIANITDNSIQLLATTNDANNLVKIQGGARCRYYG